MAMQNIFTKDKLAQSKEGYEIIASMMQPKSLQVDGLLAADVITISYSGQIDSDITPAYDAEGSVLVLSATSPSLVFYANAKVQIVKPVTVNDVGLNLV